HEDGIAGVRRLLLAALGCNIAWGIIDAIMYVMNCITMRSAKAQLIRSIQSAPDPRAAIEIIRHKVEPEFESSVGAEQREAMYRAMLEYLSGATMPRTTISRADLLGGIACFWLVFISCLPAAAPFLIFRQPLVALRVSNFLLIAMLFVVGQKWAQFAGSNRLLAGIAMVVIGLSLVGVAVLLGG
ncbi:MAG: VIT1/CCC1 transporter family protein, partial [Tepidisphaeraceae bacterium]